MDKYTEWLSGLIKDYKHRNYNKLIAFLNEFEFVWTMRMDENRAIHGVALRERYARESGNAMLYGMKPCSMLEMMVALSEQCETHIMGDSLKGNQPSKWFWVMTESMGLEIMDDNNFDAAYVTAILDRVLSHDYAPNGKGGLFYAPLCKKDMRTLDIWYQLQQYLIYKDPNLY